MHNPGANLSLLPISGGTGDFVDDGQVLLRKAVEQRRLADVWPSY